MEQVRIIVTNDTAFSFARELKGLKLVAELSMNGYAYVTEREMIAKGKVPGGFVSRTQRWCFAPEDFKQVIRA